MPGSRYPVHPGIKKFEIMSVHDRDADRLFP